ncbi:unnamed protein product [Diamesa hyperborea]
MISLFSSFNYKVFSKKSYIDNLAFKFHYRFTFTFLFLATIIVCMRTYLGDPIKCICEGIPINIVETYCFYSSTFSVVNLDDSQVGPYPGISPYDASRDTVKRHAYYQWVPFMLFGQAICFYFPHWLWKVYEGGKVLKLVAGLRKTHTSLYTDKKKSLEKDSLPKKILCIKISFLQYFRSYNLWAYRLALCEILNLGNICGQIFLTNLFLQHKFINLGYIFMNENINGFERVLDDVFPKMTKCIFYKYGASGSIQTHDALCVLALNNIHDKIFIFLWFWYIIVLAVSVLALVWRLMTVLIHSRSYWFNKAVFSLASRGHLTPSNIKLIMTFPFSSWLFLFHLAKNMDNYLFINLILSIEDEQKGTARLSNEDDEHFDSDNDKDTMPLRKRVTFCLDNVEEKELNTSLQEDLIQTDDNVETKL